MQPHFITLEFNEKHDTRRKTIKDNDKLIFALEASHILDWSVMLMKQIKSKMKSNQIWKYILNQFEINSNIIFRINRRINFPPKWPTVERFLHLFVLLNIEHTIKNLV